MSSDNIEVGDVVQVDFNSSQYTLCRDAVVVYRPLSAGDEWVFKTSHRLMVVTEPCTVTKEIK